MKKKNRKTVRWGIIGVGFIADVFATDLMLVDDCELVAVASRSMERAKVFAQKHEARKVYDSYAAMVNDPEIDAVYIATINAFHKEQTIMCLKAKKAVLCEKPMAMNIEDAKAMIQTAHHEDMLFMEGHWTRFKPTTKKLLGMVTSGEMGEIRYMESDFGYMLGDHHDPNDRRLNKELGGGALYDVGVYPLAMANMIFENSPKSIMSKQMMGETGVDLQTIAFLDYETAMVTAHCAINANTRCEVYITGTKKSVLIKDAWFGNSMTIKDLEGNEEVFEFENWGKNYTFEIEAFNEAYRNDQKQVALIPHEDSLAIIQMVDTINKK